jgi:hypothetical protein
VFCSTRTSSGSGWCSPDPSGLWSVFFSLLLCVVCLFFFSPAGNLQWLCWFWNRLFFESPVFSLCLAVLGKVLFLNRSMRFHRRSPITRCIAVFATAFRSDCLKLWSCLYSLTGAWPVRAGELASQIGM